MNIWGNQKKAIVVGHSHIAAPAAAYRMRCKRWKATSHLAFVALNEERHKPILRSDGQLNTALDATISKTIHSEKPQVSFITICGTTHIVLGLAEHPVPFTLSPEDIQNKWFMPYELVKAAMTSYMETQLSAMRLLVERLPKPVYGLEPPPPILDETHIRSILSGRHLENITQYGIASPRHRLHMWKLESEILREAYTQAGIIYLPIPEGCRNSEGFRHPKAWHIDPAHGNVWYGECVLAQMDRILGELP